MQLLQGRRNRWTHWREVRRVNPLAAIDADFAEVLREELQDARRNPADKARFLSFRMNLPSGDESTVLLTIDDWDRIIARPVPDPEGRPIVGVDLGAGCAWSAACAVWANGRAEAVALCPGIPSVADQERRDNVPAGAYQTLVDAVELIVAEGLRVPPVAPVPVEERVMRWSEAAAAIRALRKWAQDGPLAIAHESRPLIMESLCNSIVKNDDQGNCRLTKKGFNNTGRDDVSVALLLATGEVKRELDRPWDPPTWITV